MAPAGLYAPVTVQPGWPLAIPFAWCIPPPALLTAASSSLKIQCRCHLLSEVFLGLCVFHILSSEIPGVFLSSFGFFALQQAESVRWAMSPAALPSEPVHKGSLAHALDFRGPPPALGSEAAASHSGC